MQERVWCMWHCQLDDSYSNRCTNTCMYNYVCMSRHWGAWLPYVQDWADNVTCKSSELSYLHIHILLLQRRPCPEEDASFLSRITWWWQNGQIWRGWRHPIKYEDLASLNTVDQSRVVAPRFQRNWDKELRKARWVKELSNMCTLHWQYKWLHVILKIRVADIIYQIKNFTSYYHW